MFVCVNIVISIVLNRNICYYYVMISNNGEQGRRLARQVENPHLPLLT